MLKTLLFFVLAALTGIYSQEVHAGACCGGGLSSASLITGDEQARVSLAFSARAALADASETGALAFRGNDGLHEDQNLLLVDGSRLLSDRLQVGAHFEAASQAIHFTGEPQEPSTGVGDFRVNAGYEFLPEYTYSEWKPRGFAWVGLVLPTGKSIHETFEPSEALGEGFFTPTLGILFVKRWERWDAAASAEGRLSIGRKFEQELSPDFTSLSILGTQLGLGGLATVGYSPGAGDFRLGARIEPLWRSGRTVDVDGFESQTAERSMVSFGADFTWMFGPQSSLTASYTDQTFFGARGLAQNSVLSRTVGVALSHRWDR